MRYGSLVHRFDLFSHAATVAAHASFSNPGFRQRDVSFLIDLFSNWTESHFGEKLLHLQNTQILRYLEALHREGLAKKSLRSAHPRYRLTRTGLIELIRAMVEKPYFERPAHFFFLSYFIKTYRTKLIELVQLEGKEFPLAERQELESLLEVASLLEREQKRVAGVIKNLKQRVQNSHTASQLATELFHSGHSLEQAVPIIERKHPYELNNQKSLSELIFEVPPDVREFELTQGTVRRATDIWTPTVDLLTAYQASLEKLRKSLS